MKLVIGLLLCVAVLPAQIAPVDIGTGIGTGLDGERPIIARPNQPPTWCIGLNDPCSGSDPDPCLELRPLVMGSHVNSVPVSRAGHAPTSCAGAIDIADRVHLIWGRYESGNWQQWHQSFARNTVNVNQPIPGVLTDLTALNGATNGMQTDAMDLAGAENGNVYIVSHAPGLPRQCVLRWAASSSPWMSLGWPGVGLAERAKIETDQSNRVHLVYEDNAELHHAWHDGAAWTTPTVIGDSDALPDGAAALTAGTFDDLHCLFVEDAVFSASKWRFLYRHWTPGGGWEDPIPLMVLSPDPAKTSELDVFDLIVQESPLDKKGTVYVVYRDLEGTGSLRLARLDLGAKAFVDLCDIEPSDSALDAYGKPKFVHPDPDEGFSGNTVGFSWRRGSGIGRLIYAELDTNLSAPGATVRPAVDLDPGAIAPGGSFARAATTASKGSDSVVLWERRPPIGSGPRDLYVRASSDDGRSFGPSMRVDTGDAAHASDASEAQVHLTPGGAVLAAWLDDRASASSDELFANRSSSPGGSWPAAPTMISQGTAGGVESYDLGFGAGVIHLAWSYRALGSTAATLYTARSVDDGLSWSAPVAVATLPGAGLDVSEVRIAVEGVRVAIAWVEEPLGARDVHIAVSSNSGLTYTVLPAESAPTGFAYDPRVVIEDGKLAVAWIDGIFPITSGPSVVQLAISRDFFATSPSLEPEQTVSALAAATPGASVANFEMVANEERLFIVWEDNATSSSPRARLGLSPDWSRSFVRRLLDDDPLRDSSDPTVTTEGSIVVFAYAVATGGTTDIALRWSANGGADLGASSLQGATDAALATEGASIDAGNHTAFFPYRADVFGQREVHLASARLPGLITDPAPLPLAGSFEVVLTGLPAEDAIDGTFLLAVGASGTTPGTLLPGPVVVPLNVDAVTLTFLSPPFLPLFVTPLTGCTTDARLGPYPIPPSTVGLSLDAVGLVLDATGALVHFTDPIAIW